MRPETYQAKSLMARLPWIATAAGTEFIESYGVVRFVELALGTKIYLDEEDKVVGVKGWLDEELLTVVRGAHGFLTKPGKKEEVILVNWYCRTSRHGTWVEMIRRWTDALWRKHLNKHAVLVQSNGEQFYHKPFWRSDAEERIDIDIVTPPTPERLPFNFWDGEGRAVHKGEILVDKYGIGWKVLGANMDCRPPMMIVRHEVTGRVFNIIPGAFDGDLAYRPAGDAPRRRLNRAKPPNHGPGT